jgi:predicted CXXCH cytochrome family protein
MKSRLLLACLIFLFVVRPLPSQVTGDVIGRHGLGPGSTSPVSGALPGSCQYCHAPHSGLDIALWNQTLSTQTYTPYTSTTETTTGNAQPAPGTATSLCLSCHDGTVAVGLTVVYGKIPTMGSMQSSDILGTNLQPSHPVSLVLPLKDSVDLVASLSSQGKTADPTGAVKLVNGNIECTSCHDPHVEGKDPVAQNFLVRDSSNGQMCLACHDPNRSITAKVNPLAGWVTSIHATSSSRTALNANIGSYNTIAQNACTSCHSSHNARGTARLLRGPDEQDCVGCHGGGSNVSPAALNIFAEYAKTAHPVPLGNNLHDAAETVLLNNNRHATCVDCHNPHASNQVLTFTPPPVIRTSQTAVAGINSLDGVSVLNPAINQYENCLRCHGTSAGKALDPKYGYHPLRIVSGGDPLNLIPEFALSSSSSHPVMHDRTSPLSQPSLRAQMLQLDGITMGRAVGTRILCTDCHNSDDNREFGGAGPNGPHGSKWTHILERRYEFSQAVAPGLPITNLNPSPDLSVNGPYAMCAKCHDLNQVVADTSFAEHGEHIEEGFSCSVCHSAHGMGGNNASISGERLVNFDINVVAPNGSTPISYSRATNSCSLTCHNHSHAQPSGSAIRIKN